MVWIFPQNFTNFGLDTIEKQVIINLSSYSSYCYVPVDLNDSEVSFIREGCNLLSISLLRFV